MGLQQLLLLLSHYRAQTAGVSHRARGRRQDFRRGVPARAVSTRMRIAPDTHARIHVVESCVGDCTTSV